MLVWEELFAAGFGLGATFTFRTKVPGGWLVIVKHDDGQGMTFYPDPDHLWDGNSVK